MANINIYIYIEYIPVMQPIKHAVTKSAIQSTISDPGQPTILHKHAVNCKQLLKRINLLSIGSAR